MGIEIIGKKQLHRMDHRVLARAFIVWVRYDNPESTESSDKFPLMLRDFENCSLFAEPTYDTT
jgi:hypothetical protein